MSIPEGARYFLVSDSILRHLNRMDVMIQAVDNTKPPGMGLLCCLAEFRVIMTAYDNGVRIIPSFLSSNAPIVPYVEAHRAQNIIEISDTTSPSFDEVQSNPVLQSRCIALSKQAIAEAEETCSSKNIVSTATYMEVAILCVEALCMMSGRNLQQPPKKFSLIFPDGKREEYHPLLRTIGGDIIRMMDKETRSINSDAGARLLAKLTKKGPPDKTNG